MNRRYIVELSAVERGDLQTLVSGGKAPVRAVKRAQHLRTQCLDRRIGDRTTLEVEVEVEVEVAAWERQRNDEGARIDWMFTTEKARAKLGKAYPSAITSPKELAAS